MRAMIWRTALIAILLITLLGSIIVLIQEPGAASWLSLIGSIGSLLGAFVTTGLDMAATRHQPHPGAMLHPSLKATIPHDYPVAALATPKPRSFDFAALIQAATLGALASGMIGLLRGIPRSDAIFLCPQYLSFGLTGVAYVLFARSHLPAEYRVSPLHGVIGGFAVGIIASIVGSVARSVSVWAIFPANVERASALVGFTPEEEALWIVLGICMVFSLGTMFSGIGGLIAALITKPRSAPAT